MTIDGIKPDQPDAAPEGSNGSVKQKADREKWLAELEKKSFQISDDTLPQEQGRPDRASPDTNPSPAEKSPPWLENGVPAGFESEIAAPEQPQQPSVGIAPPTAGIGSAPATPGPAGIDTGVAWTQNAAINQQVNGNRFDAQAAQAAQRVEVLMNQLKFMDLNVRLTRQGEEVTLWIRDFKQKYAQQAYQWIKDLQTLLPQTGQKLTKIVVNGKQLVHINELLGGGTWQ